MAALVLCAALPLVGVARGAWAQEPADSLSRALELTPAHPRPGQPFRVVYRGMLARGGSATLPVRARFRTVDDTDQPRDAPTVVVGSLRREGSATYSATLRLPDSIAYAALAVTTPGGEQVDDAGGRAWPLVTGDASGRPTFRARILHANDYLSRNFPRAFEEAQAAVAAAPDSVWGWYLLDFYGYVQFGRSYVDSVRTDRLARIAALEARVGERARGLEAYGFMGHARLLRDTARSAAWERRLLSTPATFAFQRMLQADVIVRALRNSPRAALDSLEAFWARIGVADREVARMGVAKALAAADTAALRRWEPRYTQGVLAYEADLAAMTAQRPAFRAMGAERIEVLRRIAPERRLLAPRLSETRAQFARRAQSNDRHLAETLANARLALGDTVAGLALLDSVTATSTDTAVVLRMARLALARSDTLRAVQAFARATALPLQPSAQVPAAVTSHPRWLVTVDDARRALHASASAQDLARPVGRLRAVDAVGRSQAVTGDSATVVVYWSAGCPNSRALLPRLRTLAHEVRQLGARLVLVASEAPTAHHAELLQQAKLADLPALFDTRREVARALGAWAVPQLYVIDAADGLRFTPGDLSEVPLAVAALRGHMASSDSRAVNGRR